tara:strand:- start:3011 stop:3133 length:123 start_codon:yes stop_codon:yes gene_type:complete
LNKKQLEALEKEHEARMKKYRKIWKERGCIHWEDKDEKRK